MIKCIWMEKREGRIRKEWIFGMLLVYSKVYCRLSKSASAVLQSWAFPLYLSCKKLHQNHPTFLQFPIIPPECGSLFLAGTLNVYISHFTSVNMHLKQESIIGLSPGEMYIWAIMPSIQKSVGFYSYNLFYYTCRVIGLDLYPLNLDLTPLTNLQSQQEVSRNQTCTYWLQHWVHY